MMYHKEPLAKAIRAYMGTDILIEIGRKPRWKDSINATRETLACHDQRDSLQAPLALQYLILYSSA
jgi:hypothetical protein